MIRTAIQAEEVDNDDSLIFIQNSLLIFFLLVGCWVGWFVAWFVGWLAG